MCLAFSISSAYWARRVSSTWAVGGARAGAATNSWQAALVSRVRRAAIYQRGAAAYQTGVANQLASQPQEGLLEVIIGLGRDVVILQVLLAVEGDGLGLHLALLHVDLVAAQDDGDVLADADEITWTIAC